MIIEGKSDFVYKKLDYETYKRAHDQGILTDKIATRYKRSLQEVKALSTDPDHGGQVTLSSLLETMVAFELEKDGILGCKVTRGPAHTDLEDGWGRKWDVKTPPYVENIGFNEKSAIESVLRKLAEFPKGDVGILLDISFLHEQNYRHLVTDLKTQLTENQKFFVRQVTVTGVL